MSLAIPVGEVRRVLLADGWHDVAPAAGSKGLSSFKLDAYEYVDDESSGGQKLAAGMPTPGFSFHEDGGGQLYGPLTSILAVDTRQPPKL